MLFRKIIPVYFDNHRNLINTLFGQMKVEPSGLKAKVFNYVKRKADSNHLCISQLSRKKAILLHAVSL